MKRLLFLVLIITLPIIAFFEWAAYKRANYPSDFIYQTSDNVDMNYHKPEVLANYFQAAAELEHHGRYCWKAYKLDVMADKPIESPGKDLVAAYQQKLAHVRQMEAILERSAQLKEKGVSDEDARLMLDLDLSASDLETYKFLNGKETLEFEEQGEGIFKAQQLLKEKGYDLPVDGYFERKTLEAVKAFQKDAGIYPTGKIGNLTVKKLLE
jgi:murein L,D-transpeptidase YcbB/YkuD